ncbi:MAG: 2-keto-4-pentenoate hydratase [Candidatus Rokubacteria bacterium]|nr:2-keto-4-pentenoate hydratase [Candidatus Rokubacteria bacterium]
MGDPLIEALVARGERVAGWKAGFTSKPAQTAYGATEPVCAFLLASGVFPSRAEVPAARFVTPVVEAEGALPALELIDLRYTGKPAASDLIADGVAANAIVLGAPLTDVRGLDLALEGLVYEHNGTVAATNTAAEVLGSPLNALAWIANHLGARGLGLRAGDVVMSGSVSVLLRPKAGDSVRATFTRLGSVGVRLA